MSTQNKQILNYLETGKPLSPLQALRMFGCMRLASRINDLRKQGHFIVTDMVKDSKKKTWANYRLVSQIKMLNQK